MNTECTKCGVPRTKETFSKNQWKKVNGKCKKCAERLAQSYQNPESRARKLRRTLKDQERLASLWRMLKNNRCGGLHPSNFKEAMILYPWLKDCQSLNESNVCSCASGKCPPTYITEYDEYNMHHHHAVLVSSLKGKEEHMLPIKCIVKVDGEWYAILCYTLCSLPACSFPAIENYKRLFRSGSLDPLEYMASSMVIDAGYKNVVHMCMSCRNLVAAFSFL